jgi:hypothetical protein
MPCSSAVWSRADFRSSVSAVSVVSSSVLDDFSSASNSVSSAISERNRDSTVSRPEISCACRNCVIMNTDNRKVMTSNSCAIASTKPGQ